MKFDIKYPENVSPALKEKLDSLLTDYSSNSHEFALLLLELWKIPENLRPVPNKCVAFFKTSGKEPTLAVIEKEIKNLKKIGAQLKHTHGRRLGISLKAKQSEEASGIIQLDFEIYKKHRSDEIILEYLNKILIKTIEPKPKKIRETKNNVDIRPLNEQRPKDFLPKKTNKTTKKQRLIALIALIKHPLFHAFISGLTVTLGLAISGIAALGKLAILAYGTLAGLFTFALEKKYKQYKNKPTGNIKKEQFKEVPKKTPKAVLNAYSQSLAANDASRASITTSNPINENKKNAL